MGTGGSSGPRPSSLQEVIASLVGAAVQAVCFADTGESAECLDMLATEQTTGWGQALSRELVRYLRLAVTSAWRSGWQPAELARHVGRELGAAHEKVAAEMIVDEMRGYAPPTVDDRWAAQVASLGAEVRWATDAEYLTGRDRIATAIDLLHLLQHIQTLESLCPLPGTARAGASLRSEADERILGKIRALLAKAESTEFPDEAEALSARAQELMAKYSIDHALLTARAGHRDAPGARRVPVDNPYESPKASLLQTVAKANRCRAVWQKELGLTTVVGFHADLDAVELLFTSLLVQANTAMLRAGAKKDASGRSRTRAFRQSFLVAYAMRIGERLNEATGHAEREAAASAPGGDLLPVLAARSQAVDDAVDEMFGDHLIAVGRGMRATDWEGWNSGRAAADLATLNAHREVAASA
jgi:hypothetical protein